MPACADTDNCGGGILPSRSATGVARCYAIGMTQNGTTQTQTPTSRTRISSKTGKAYRAHGDGSADRRGSARDRKARKIFLLSPAAGFGGDGAKVPCFYCGEMLDYFTVQADRIIADGPYRRTNIRPADVTCNNARRAAGNPISWTPTVGPFAF